MDATNWYVLTGGPYSGKSTTLNALHSKGYRVVKEVARAYIERQLAQGHSLQAITGDQLHFQRTLLQEMLQNEKKLDQEEITFLDRALPDGIGYFVHGNLDPGEVVSLCKAQHYRYRKVFLLDMLPSSDKTKDVVRREDRRDALLLAQQIEAGYIQLGYPVVHVPVLPLEERVRFILDHVDRKEA
jgi:predicted ATPase